MKRREVVPVLISVSLFCLALTQDAYYIDGQNPQAWASPMALLLVGWLGAFMGGGAAITWFANPLLFLSWAVVFFNKPWAAALSTAATLLAGAFLLFDKVISSEAPTYSLITRCGAGYWLWLLSMVAFATGVLLITKATRQRQS